MTSAADDYSPEMSPSETSEEPHATLASMSVTIVANGPYIVCGSIPLVEEVITPVGKHYEYRQTQVFPLKDQYALCRCGKTKTPPFCDGAHVCTHFDGEEVASREPFEERADQYDGAGVYLLDDNRCAFARFCHREDGDVWSLTEKSGDKRLEGEAIKASSDCPAGRLVHYHAGSDAVCEPTHEPTISLLQDPQKSVSGPLFVRGGIPLISADGSAYELRNRYALCRCGSSQNMPFCDATHISVGFTDKE